MEESAHVLLLRLFRDMPDPRMVGKVSHKLDDILVITVCAVICGLDHWTQIEDFGKAYEAWFGTFLDLPNGIPSHDTFGKVLAALEPDAFERRIQLWIHALLGSHTEGKHIAIDGKTLIWNDLCQTPSSVFFGFWLHGFLSDVRGQASSTMNQSDMPGLAAARRPRADSEILRRKCGVLRASIQHRSAADIGWPPVTPAPDAATRSRASSGGEGSAHH